MIVQKLNPSLVMERTVPHYVVTEFPKFVSFVRAYYQYLEQDGELIGRLNKFLSNLDIHTVSDDDAQYKILSMFLESIPKTLEVDYSILVQNIRKFYASKGTEGSIKTFLYLMSEARKPNTITIAYTGDADALVGQTLTGTASGATATVPRASYVSGSSSYVVIQLSYTSTRAFFNSNDSIRLSSGAEYVVYVEDFNVDIFYPKNYLLRTSDGVYASQRHCRIIVPPNRTLTAFENSSFVNGSGSTGRIDIASYSVGQIGENFVYDLVLSFASFKGWKDVGETLTIAGETYALVDCFTGVTVDSGGLGYSVGDKFTITRSGVTVANIVVDVVAKSNITEIMVSSGGSGYSIGDKFQFVYSDGNHGGGWVTGVNNGVITSAKAYHSKRYSDEYPTISFETDNDTAVLYPLSKSTGAIVSAYVDDVSFNLDGTEVVIFPDVENYLQKAQVSLNIGSLYSTKKTYEDSRGQPSSSYKIQDSYYWQDFSYVLKMNKSIDFSTTSDLYNKVVHPSGTKVFLEYVKLPSKVSIDRQSKHSVEQYLTTEHTMFNNAHKADSMTIDSVDRIKDMSPLQYFSLPFAIGEDYKTIVLNSICFETYTMTLDEINSPIHRYNNVVECHPFIITIGS